jgi:hypothetical protein
VLIQSRARKSYPSALDAQSLCGLCGAAKIVERLASGSRGAHGQQFAVADHFFNP